MEKDSLEPSEPADAYSTATGIVRNYLSYAFNCDNFMFLLKFGPVASATGNRIRNAKEGCAVFYGLCERVLISK